MTWPLSHDFNEAIQNPRLALADVDLKTAEAVVGAQGLPLPRSGNFADVYQLRGADGRDWAVKCFTRPVVGLAERYAKVSAALARANFPFTVEFSFLAEGIRVGDAWWPVVKMDWVEGLLLNQVVRDNAGRPTVLAALLQMWVKLCKRLRETGIAHADLQHGNVLLVPGSRPGAYGLKLIDYDGMYVPALANRPSGEVGHSSYQHPTRGSSRAYSLDVDRFPHLVVATALKGLEIVGQDLWARHDTGDNLLFTEGDFHKPAASKLMKELWRTDSPAVQAFVGRLAAASTKSIPQTPWLDQIAPDGDPVPLNNDERREVAGMLGLALPIPTALPPEPSAVAALPALPFPAQPSPALPLPNEATSAPATNHLEFAIERGVTPKTKKRSPAPEGTSSGRLLLIAGGLVLLVGAVVAGVLLTGGKSNPTDTANADNTDPRDVAPKPKEKRSDDASVKPKNKQLDPLVKPQDRTFEPIVRQPIGKRQVVERWRVELGEAPITSRVVCSSDSRTAVAMGGDKFPTIALDLATGKQLAGSENKVVSPNYPPIPLADGRFAIDQGKPDSPVLLWDVKAGRMEGTLKSIARPEQVPGHTVVSPNGEYIAFAGDGRNEPLPFRLKNVLTDKMILELELVGGKVFFTADCSRVLVVQATGPCRWYKLPSGEPDGEWELAQLPLRFRGVGPFAMSGDGTLLLFDGRLEGKTESFHLIDARNGAIHRSFSGNYMSRTADLSADGRLLVVQKVDASKRFHSADVIDTVSATVVAELSAPSGNDYLFPTLIPDGSGVIAIVVRNPGSTQTAIRYDLIPESTKPKVEPSPLGGPAWTVQLPDARGLTLIHANSDADLVLLGAPRGGVAGFEFKTGRPRDGFTELATQGVVQFVRMNGDRIGTIAPSMDEVLVWDANTGKNLRAIAVPEIPPGAGNAKFARVWLSPDGKYLAVGRSGSPAADNPDVPLQVFDTSSNRLILSTTWKGGSAHFTTDSTRVLLAEWPGRCRWFKLPSCEADGGWDLGVPPAGRRHTVYGISADGSFVAYNGPLGSKDGAQFPAIIDGKTGTVIRQFKDHLAVSDLSISADGRRVALMRGFSADACDIEAVEAATGKTLKRVNVNSGRSLPPYTLSPDGRMLFVFNPVEKKVHVYDVPASAPD